MVAQSYDGTSLGIGTVLLLLGGILCLFVICVGCTLGLPPIWSIVAVLLYSIMLGILLGAGIRSGKYSQEFIRRDIDYICLARRIVISLLTMGTLTGFIGYMKFILTIDRTGKVVKKWTQRRGHLF